MLDWLGQEGDRLRDAFTEAFGPSCRPFGSRATAIGGVSDGTDGVQWNASYDPRDGRQWVSVNLEGMQYEDWPVARLIRRELAKPLLLAVGQRNAGGPPVEVRWARDYWQVQSRPLIREADIRPTPVAVRELTETMWRQALEGARECLHPRKDRNGRATQQVTIVASGKQVTGPVAPHLTVNTAVGDANFVARLVRRCKVTPDGVLRLGARAVAIAGANSSSYRVRRSRNSFSKRDGGSTWRHFAPIPAGFGRFPCVTR